jgi:hypothetical protein
MFGSERLITRFETDPTARVNAQESEVLETSGFATVDETVAGAIPVARSTDAEVVQRYVKRAVVRFHRAAKFDLSWAKLSLSARLLGSTRCTHILVKTFPYWRF